MIEQYLQYTLKTEDFLEKSLALVISAEVNGRYKYSVSFK